MEQIPQSLRRKPRYTIEDKETSDVPGLQLMMSEIGAVSDDRHIAWLDSTSDGISQDAVAQSFPWIGIGSHDIEQRGINIYLTDNCFVTQGGVATRDNQWDSPIVGDSVIIGFPQHPVAVELSVVADDGNNGIIGQTLAVQVIDENADAAIGEMHAIEVATCLGIKGVAAVDP